MINELKAFKKALQEVENFNKEYPFFIDEKNIIIISSNKQSNKKEDTESEFWLHFKKNDYSNIKSLFITNNEKFLEEIESKKTKMEYKYTKTKYAVDIIVQYEDKIVLINRKFPPLGYAMPGGFIDKGETETDAALRELEKETKIKIDKNKIKKFSKRLKVSKTDPRSQEGVDIFTTLFFVKINQQQLESIVASDDATDYRLISINDLKNKKLAFKHHEKILNSFCNELQVPSI